MDTVGWLRRFIAYNTTSDQSNLALIDSVANFLTTQGFLPWLVQNGDYSKANLFVTLWQPTAG